MVGLVPLVASSCTAPPADPAPHASSSPSAASDASASAGASSGADVARVPAPKIAPLRLRFGGALEDVARAVALAPDGSVLVGGRCGGDVDFGAGVLALQEFEREGFLARFDSQGRIAWAKRLGTEVHAVVTDASGGFVVTGDFSSTFDFGGGPLRAVQGGSTFVARFDATGAHLWSKTFDAGGRSVAIDRAGNVYWAGIVHNTVDFGGGALKSTIAPTMGPITNTFVVKFDPQGRHVWSKRYGSDLTYSPHLSIDPLGDLVISGGTKGSFSLDGERLAVTKGWGVYLAKFAPDGERRWSKIVSGTRAYSSAPSGCDAQGNVVLAGDFSQSFDAGGGPVERAGGSGDVLVAKFGGDGRHLWSRAYGGKGRDQIDAMSVDASGAIALTGSFDGTADFGGGALASAGKLDAFVVQLDSEGAHHASHRLGGTGWDEVFALASDGAGVLVAAGRFVERADLVGGPPLVSAGDADLFVVSFAK